MRPNKASELVSATCTFSRPISGRNSAACSVVKATSVPIVIVPAVIGSPALR